MEKIRVLLADDDILVQDRFKEILSKCKEIDIVGITGDGYEAILEAALAKPDVFLLDLDMEFPGSGFVVAKHLAERFSCIHIIFLVSDEDQFIDLPELNSIITDYLNKEATPEEIIQCIHQSHEGEPADDKPLSIESNLYDSTEGFIENTLMYTLNIISTLTPSELEILKLIIEEKSWDEICRMENTRIQKLHKIKRSILEKFQHNSIEEVAATIRNLHISDYLNHFL